MSPEGPVPQPLRELRYALAEGDAQTPGAGARGRAVAAALAALAARSPGRPVDQPPAISAVEAFRRTVAGLGSVLGGLSSAQWSRAALRGLSVQGLVGHLTGVELQFLAQLDRFANAGASAPAPGDHIASTQPTALAQAGRPAGRPPPRMGTGWRAPLPLSRASPSLTAAPRWRRSTSTVHASPRQDARGESI